MLDDDFLENLFNNTTSTTYSNSNQKEITFESISKTVEDIKGVPIVWGFVDKKDMNYFLDEFCTEKSTENILNIPILGGLNITPYGNEYIVHSSKYNDIASYLNIARKFLNDNTGRI